MGSGPPKARQSRSLPSLMPLSLKRLLIRPSDERSPISERKFPLANNRRRRLLAFFTRPRSTNGGRSSKRRESRRSEEMFALGHKQTFSKVCAMSASPPKADIGTQPRDVRFVPQADSCTAANGGKKGLLMLPPMRGLL